MQILDTHTHVVSKDRARYPLVTEERTDATAWFLDHGVTGEGLLERMDGAGVDAAVLVQAGSSYGTDHSYVVDSVPAGGGRLAGIGTVDLAGEDVRVHARHAIEVAGLSGIRLFDLGTGELSSHGALAVGRRERRLRPGRPRQHLPEGLVDDLRRCVGRDSPGVRRRAHRPFWWRTCPVGIGLRPHVRPALPDAGRPGPPHHRRPVPGRPGRGAVGDGRAPVAGAAPARP